MKNESKLPTIVLVMLTSINIFLMVANAGLFLRMNRLQNAVLTAIQSSPANTTAREIEMGLEPGSPVPAFTLPDTAGQTVSLDELNEQKILLIFFSHQCSACINVLSHLKAFNESETSVQMVMISKGSVEQNQQLATELGNSVPILTWEEATVGVYEVPFTPFFYVIDKGVVANKGPVSSLEQLENLVRN